MHRVNVWILSSLACCPCANGPEHTARGRRRRSRSLSLENLRERARESLEANAGAGKRKSNCGAFARLPSPSEDRSRQHTSIRRRRRPKESIDSDRTVESAPAPTGRPLWMERAGGLVRSNRRPAGVVRAQQAHRAGWGDLLLRVRASESEGCWHDATGARTNGPDTSRLPTRLRTRGRPCDASGLLLGLPAAGAQAPRPSKP